MKMPTDEILRSRQIQKKEYLMDQTLINMGGKGEEDIKGDRWVMPFTGLRDTEKVPVWERNSNIKS